MNFTTETSREYLIQYMRSAVRNDTFTQYIRTELAGDFAYELSRAMFAAAGMDCQNALHDVRSLIEMCLVHGDFTNGVTDPTGMIDEGDVKAGAVIESASVALQVLQAHADSHPRFPMTYCSQCGCELGPGNEGASSCKDHK